MPVGRPTKLNQELVDKASTYLSWCVGKRTLPKMVGLALYLDISDETLYAWMHEGEENMDSEENQLKRLFSETARQVQQKQEEMLIDKGLYNEYNSSIAKLLLGRHGYHERTESDVTSKGEKIEVSNPALEIIARQLADQLKKDQT